MLTNALEIAIRNGVFLQDLPYSWVAPSYRVDKAGRAYNFPAVTGGELFTNPGFTSDTAWSKGAGWSIGSGVASRSGTAAQSNLTQAPAIDRYKLYRLTYKLTSLSAGSILGIVQGAGTGQRRTALGTYAAWARVGQSTTYGFQAIANSVLSIDNASLYEIDMDTALAMINVGEDVHRIGIAFETPPVDDALMLVMYASGSNSLYNCVLAPIFQNTDGTYRVRLLKIVDGVPSATIGSDGMITFVPGAKLEIYRDGTAFTVFYNGEPTAATGTITDASIIGNTYHGFCILGLAGLASNFWVNGRRVPFTFPTPQVLVSDGFSQVGVTDGLGHTGAAGGAGKMWLDGGFGDFTTAAGKLTWNNVSGQGDPYVVAAGAVDVDVAVDVYWDSGESSVIVRRSSDGTDYVSVAHDGTNIVLSKFLNYAPTVLMMEAVPYIAGAKLRLLAKGAMFQVYYNDTPINIAQVISDAELQTGTDVGLSANGDGNQFDNFVCYSS